MMLKKVLALASAITFSCVLFVNTTFAATHTVKSGETLEKISEKYETTVDVLLDLNDLKSTEEAELGLVLQLPSHIKNKPAVQIDEEEELDVVKTFKVSASAYTAYCTGCSGFSRTGINLRKDPGIKVISVDPKVIPLGTKVWVEGYGIAIAGDTGGSIKGNKIDILVADKATAYKWGRRTVTVKILK
ncbi:3D domain-containing protein [Solibacillus sp. FSL H8-0538]|uniref:3D domain-containing protein n=1 Tax=Solibacillus sp. FSL H8-0538 TaxID=2921400 RepID=UPI0030FC050F